MLPNFGVRIYLDSAVVSSQLSVVIPRPSVKNIINFRKFPKLGGPESHRARVRIRPVRAPGLPENNKNVVTIVIVVIVVIVVMAPTTCRGGRGESHNLRQEPI